MFYFFLLGKIWAWSASAVHFGSPVLPGTMHILSHEHICLQLSSDETHFMCKFCSPGMKKYLVGFTLTPGGTIGEDPASLKGLGEEGFLGNSEKPWHAKVCPFAADSISPYH